MDTKTAFKRLMCAVMVALTILTSAPLTGGKDNPFAVEADAAWLEDCAGLGVQGLWHIWGYERFDPFLTFGARGWIDGDLGPVAGIGAFYHLTDNWSLRADAQTVLGIDCDFNMVYSLGVGVQYTF